jgi:hypothetical protein
MSMESFNSWCTTHRRPLRRAGFVLLVVYLVYLLAANVFLNTSIGEQVINRKPDRFQARWGWALSAYPGHIHAHGVVLGGHARTNRWFVASPRADGRIKLLPLLWREVGFGTIRAVDVSVHVQRVAEDKPTIKRPGKPPWELSFDAITTPSLLRMDFYDARVRGHGQARFVFRKRLQGGAMEVGPSTLHMPDAILQVGEVEVVRDGRLDFEISLPLHTRERAQGAEKVGLMHARMRVDGPAPGIDLVAHDGQALPLGARGAAGRLRADLTLSRGALMPGSWLDWSAPVFSRGVDGEAVRHPLGVVLRTRREAIALAARMPPTSEGAPWLAADLRVDDRRLGPDDWLRPLRALGGTVRTRWPAMPLRWIDVFLDDIPWLEINGRANLYADVRLDAGAMQAGSRIDVEDAQVQARVLDNRFSGQARARLRMRGEDDASLHTTIAIVMQQFTLAPIAAPESIDLRGRDLRLDLQSTGPLARFHENLDAHLHFDDAQVPDLRSYNRYMPAQSARLLGGSASASADIHLDNAGEMLGGRMQMRGQDVRFALGPSRLAGNLVLDSRLSRVEKGERRYALDEMAVRLDGVRLESSGADAGWWARMRLTQGEIDWQEPFEVAGRGQVDMRDASVLLGLFAERDAFPGWVGNLVDAGQARATGDLRIRGGEIVLDRVEASNERFDLKARMRIAAGAPAGDLYARWGLLGMGMELHDGQRKMHIVGARDWYDARPALLKESD